MTTDPTLMFVLGGSFPTDQWMEDEIIRRTSLRHERFGAMLARHAGGRHTLDLDKRLNLLRAAIAGRPDRSVVVVGRSSGAITATLLAHQGAPQIRAIVALGYPFRHPAQPEDPARTAHLASLATPTLIFQGVKDVYGTPESSARYPMAPVISVVPVVCSHEFRLAATDWDRVVAAINRFAEAPTGAAVHGARGGT